MSKFFIVETINGVETVECRNGESVHAKRGNRQVLAGPYFNTPPGPEKMAMAQRFSREWVPAVEQSNY